MGKPAVVIADKITGTCSIHQIPNPSSGAPQPSPPMPFSAPIVMGLATKVLIGGKPVAVVGSSGYNMPPHVGLHASDPYMSPTTQEGRVVGGSATVMIEGKPAAHTGCNVMICGGMSGVVTGSASNVMIG